MELTLPLLQERGHLFVPLEDGFVVVDTGAPASFSHGGSLTLGTKRFDVAESYLGLTSHTLSGLLGTQVAGLLGADLLNQFDVVFDVRRGSLGLADTTLDVTGSDVPLDDLLGVPIIAVECDTQPVRMFFDTGAQVSYLLSTDLSRYPDAGRLDDFYPGFGTFSTETHTVPFSVAGRHVELRCGHLPDLLGLMVSMGDASGILGNEVLTRMTVAFLPRRRVLRVL
jgi:hypothetical protein